MTNLLISFGSRARGDADPYSDIDLLEVFDEQPSFSERDILQMPRDRFLAASRSGSLFVKHLFSEGKLVHGDQAKLDFFKRSWLPASSYRSEIESNRDLLELLSYVPGNQAGFNAAVDILICALRSILIRLAAEEGEYLFSWASLSNRSLRAGLLRSDGPDRIQVARRLKNLYRAEMPGVVTATFISDLIEAAEPAVGSVNFRISEFIPYNLPEKYAAKSYKQLRAMELVRAAYPDDPDTRAWSDWIRNPRRFCLSAEY